uniref:Uncharacterized protein n=1 Tax=Anopheles culicifacies TaxID=139723 RepID=A0A182LUU5_9DIPT
MGTNSSGRESNALLGGLLNVTVVSSHDGSTSQSQSRSARDDAMGSGQDVVVGKDGTSAQTGTGGEVAQQGNLVRELTGRSFLTVDDTVGRNQLAVDLHFRWQTGPVVIEFIDRAHLGPIDIDPFGAGNGQETNKKHEGFHLDDTDPPSRTLSTVRYRLSRPQAKISRGCKAMEEEEEECYLEILSFSERHSKTPN